MLPSMSPSAIAQPSRPKRQRDVACGHRQAANATSLRTESQTNWGWPISNWEPVPKGDQSLRERNLPRSLLRKSTSIASRSQGM